MTIGTMAYVTCAVLAAVVASASAAALPLPSYIKPCKLNDPNLNDCILKHGREAIPSILKGDPKYKVPVMDPVRITEISVSDPGFNLTMSNVRVNGVRDMEFRAGTYDPETREVEWQFFLPRMEVLFDYKVAGRILVLPLTGSGPGNITLLDVPLKMNFGFELKKKDDGKEYAYPTKMIPTFDASRVYIQLDNLFNGDKLLGENTNKFLNENWREVTTDVGPVLASAMAEAMRQLLANIAAQVPYDNIFIK